MCRFGVPDLPLSIAGVRCARLSLQILLDLVELSSPSNKEYLASLAAERMKPLIEEAEELEKTRLEE